MTNGRWRDRCVAALGLTVIWVLLWGSFTPLTLVGGLVVAVVVLIVFPLPPVTYAGRIHPYGVLRFTVRFLRDMVLASAQVASLAFRFGHTPRSAVIAVPLRCPSDLNLTLTAEALSLVPGSLIVDVDRKRGILYVHVLGVSDPPSVEHFRQDVLELEGRIIRAFGSAAERRVISEVPA
ncbi:Na+/H+ antiporter subunit E [Paractinoplanes abujensis]|uniref:Multicomponent Na+:H+ antiporter subunit E n=1 Tax=Paractinoplanes abujensis TaxID=882441 RepID=A0A7W7CPH8_9ACTN|nr:Na+/H+ antiporter subunit E [Actinoplanes abujensis]MBB4692327.1 multicomponent Na+:H+ antiporter subunit E [Actinoplanes abujensis]GID24195.1 Na+/H+ antiporter subunit E [Actinoplanes abujensis]